MEQPKNYSSLDSEVRPQPVPASRSRLGKPLDGSFSARRHRESNLDIHVLSEKLSYLSREQRDEYARHTLKTHYSEVFQKKRQEQNYKVCIDYMDGQQKERYLVRTSKNSLRDVKAKLPIKGNYRLFFIHSNNECEEVEDDEAVLPYHEKDGAFVIYCRAFAK